MFWGLFSLDIVPETPLDLGWVVGVPVDPPTGSPVIVGHPSPNCKETPGT